MIDIDNNLEVSSNYTKKLDGILTASKPNPDKKHHKYVLTVHQWVYNEHTDEIILEVLSELEAEIFNRIINKINERKSKKPRRKQQVAKDTRPETEPSNY